MTLGELEGKVIDGVKITLDKPSLRKIELTDSELYLISIFISQRLSNPLIIPLSCRLHLDWIGHDIHKDVVIGKIRKAKVNHFLSKIQ